MSVMQRMERRMKQQEEKVQEEEETVLEMINDYHTLR